MKWIIIPLFILGCSFSLAAYGAQDPNQKRTYKRITITIWILLLILVNFGFPDSIGYRVIWGEG